MFKFAFLLIAFAAITGASPGNVLDVHVEYRPGQIILTPIKQSTEEENVVPETRPLPIPEAEEENIVPETRPLPIPEAEEETSQEDDVVKPDTRPLPSPEETVTENPCTVCFEYITVLIEQLTDSVNSQPEATPEIEEEEDLGTGHIGIPSPNQVIPGGNSRPLPGVILG